MPARLLLAFLALLVCSQWAHALDVPELKGRVNDYADIISPQMEQKLTAYMAELEQTDSTQLAVLTIPSLEGDALEDFSIRVVEGWQLGRGDVDNGALLLVAREERKVRIEVGYGLEGKLTDLTSGRIIDYEIVPRFKIGDFDGGVAAGVAAMGETVRGEYQAPSGPPSGKKEGNPLSAALFLLLFAFFLGGMSRVLAGVAGAVAGGLVGVALGSLLFIPLAMIGGFGLGFLGSGLFGGFGRGFHTSSRYRRRHSGFMFLPGGFYGGGRSGGGFGGGGFGGFSGGGGGFGGGGASGGW